MRFGRTARMAGLSAVAAAAGWLVLAAAGATAQQNPGLLNDRPLPLPHGADTQQSRTNTAVEFVSPAEVTIPAARAAEVDLEFHVAQGLHINSHAPRDKDLIATHLAVIEGGGLRIASVDFPPGMYYSPAFAPGDKLSVYTGSFTLRAHLSATAGEHELQGALHYQACDINSCRPPESLPVMVRIIAK